MNVQISHRSLANLELVDAVDAGKQVACPVYIARSALCHADSLCFGLVASWQCAHESDQNYLPYNAFNLHGHRTMQKWPWTLPGVQFVLFMGLIMGVQLLPSSQSRESIKANDGAGVQIMKEQWCYMSLCMQLCYAVSIGCNQYWCITWCTVHGSNWVWFTCYSDVIVKCKIRYASHLLVSELCNLQNVPWNTTWKNTNLPKMHDKHKQVDRYPSRMCRQLYKLCNSWIRKGSHHTRVMQVQSLVLQFRNVLERQLPALCANNPLCKMKSDINTKYCDTKQTVL